jgi:hypothetical protein
MSHCGVSQLYKRGSFELKSSVSQKCLVIWRVRLYKKNKIKWRNISHPMAQINSHYYVIVFHLVVFEWMKSLYEGDVKYPLRTSKGSFFYTPARKMASWLTIDRV